MGTVAILAQVTAFIVCCCHVDLCYIHNNIPVLSAMDQTEKAYQKQDAVFIGSKRLLGKKSKRALRYFKNVGLGFATPKEAKDGNYVDKKCPFTGNVSIRGKIIKGMVLSAKMNRTITI